MRLMTLGIIFAVMTVSVHGFAELYQYTDQDGNVRFTDNPANIPEANLENVKIMDEIVSIPDESQAVVPEDSMPDTIEPPEIVVPEQPVDQEVDKKVLNEEAQAAKKNLEREKEELQALYEEIETAKNKLGEPPSESTSRLERRVYQQDAFEVNRRINDYKERQKAYQKKLDAFNSGNYQKATGD